MRSFNLPTAIGKTLCKNFIHRPGVTIFFNCPNATGSVSPLFRPQMVFDLEDRVEQGSHAAEQTANAYYQNQQTRNPIHLFEGHDARDARGECFLQVRCLSWIWNEHIHRSIDQMSYRPHVQNGLKCEEDQKDQRNEAQKRGKSQAPTEQKEIVIAHPDKQTAQIISTKAFFRYLLIHRFQCNKEKSHSVFAL